MKPKPSTLLEELKMAREMGIPVRLESFEVPRWIEENAGEREKQVPAPDAQEAQARDFLRTLRAAIKGEKAIADKASHLGFLRIEFMGARRPVMRRVMALSWLLEKLDKAATEKTAWDLDSGLASVELDFGDLWLLRKILESLLEDKDARDIVWESVKNRPKDSLLPSALALYVVIHSRDKPEKKVKGELEDKGFTTNQIKHALAEYRRPWERALADIPRDDIPLVRAWGDKELRRQARRVARTARGKK